MKAAIFFLVFLLYVILSKSLSFIFILWVVGTCIGCEGWTVLYKCAVDHVVPKVEIKWSS